MLSKKHKSQNGFTIIEVLIVLAIAGLILLIVFLAVPALQRNARNTQRKNDVSGLLGGMTEYVNNNNGSLPAAAGTLGAAGATTATIGASGTNTVDVKVGYYDPAKLSIVNSGNVANPNDHDTVIIVKGAKCGGTGNADAVVPAPARQFVALYMAENNAKQCQAS